jgi:hypothetical protein
MGAVNTTYTFTATDTITSAKMNNIIGQTTMTSDACLSGGGLQVADGQLSISNGAINSSRLATDSVTSANIVDGTIVNADINASAAIAGTKISPNFGTQNIQATGNVSLTNTGSCIVQADSGTVSGQLYSSSTNSSVAVGSVSNNPLVVFTNNAERMRITTSGNVGIGTTSPSVKLTIIAPSGGTSALFSDNVNSTLSIKHESPGNLLTYDTAGTASQRWVLNGVEMARISSDGNVGIGTTTPSSKLQVNGTVTATAFSGPLTGNVTGNASSASTVSNSAITAAKLDGNQSGSAPIFGARAWVNFNGTGTIAIRNSGNVSSLSDNSVGNYSVNFATAMLDANFSTVVTSGRDGSNSDLLQTIVQPGSGAGVQVLLSQTNTGTTRDDSNVVCVSVFR